MIFKANLIVFVLVTFLYEVYEIICKKLGLSISISNQIYKGGEIPIYSDYNIILTTILEIFIILSVMLFIYIISLIFLRVGKKIFFIGVFFGTLLFNISLSFIMSTENSLIYKVFYILTGYEKLTGKFSLVNLNISFSIIFLIFLLITYFANRRVVIKI